MAKSRLVGQYPVIGIRPTIDGRKGILDVRGSLEEQTMNMAKSAAELLRKVNREYDFLSRIEKCNLGIEGVKKYLELVNKYNDRNAKIFLELEFYKNVNMIGKGLIDEYEKENMLDDLEENMSLNKNEILSMFENIDKNMFMLKRLNTYLNNTLTF